MARFFKPLDCRDVKKILKNLGFVFRNQEGSHENWVRHEPPPFRKVTVDCPKEPFSHMLTESMARQAGVTKKEFYSHLK